MCRLLRQRTRFSQSVSQTAQKPGEGGPERDGRALAIAFRVLTRRLLVWRTRFSQEREPDRSETGV